MAAQFQIRLLEAALVSEERRKTLSYFLYETTFDPSFQVTVVSMMFLVPILMVYYAL
jgi:hypothetical protein